MEKSKKIVMLGDMDNKVFGSGSGSGNKSGSEKSKK
jgi:hypothetical protein